MPPDTARATDRRTRRTRRALREALLSLLEQHAWDDFGVQDICDRADIGRSTFYSHYQGKEQLLAGALTDLRALLREQAAGAGNAQPEPLGVVRGLIDHVGEQRKMFRSVIGRKSSLAVQMRFREMVRQLVAEDIAPLAGPGWQRDAAAHYLAGALVELLAWWVDSGGTVTSEELERYFQRLTRPALAQLAGAEA